MAITRDQALEALKRHETEVSARLTTAQADVDRAQAVLADAKLVRAGIIEEAVSEGWSLAKIGRSLGVTRQRVAQLRASGADQ